MCEINLESIDGILYSYMFNENSGSYATIGQNIVFETINFIRADNKKHYLYIPPKGLVKAPKINHVLFTVSSGTNKVRILYLAEVKEYTDHYPKGEIEVYGGDIKYDGISLERIFEKNSSNNGKYVNYICENIWKPEKETDIYTKINRDNNEISIYLSTCDKALYSHKLNKDSKGKGVDKYFKELKPQSMYSYFSNDQGNTDIKKIIEKINWTDAKDDILTPKGIKKDIKKRKYRETTFFNLVGKENDELVFSNMFAYFFSVNLEVFKNFAHEVLKLELDISHNENGIPKLKIMREYKYIDIYISDGTEHIIIENKIKSGINGKKGKNNSQLSDYVNKIHIGEKDKDGEYSSPVAFDNIHCFIFIPNYYKFGDEEKYLKVSTENGEYKEYTPILYSDIYNYYMDNKDTLEKNMTEDYKIYLKIFLESMAKHISDTDTDIEDRMKARFVNRIDFLKKEKNTK